MELNFAVYDRVAQVRMFNIHYIDIEMSRKGVSFIIIIIMVVEEMALCLGEIIKWFRWSLQRSAATLLLARRGPTLIFSPSDRSFQFAEFGGGFQYFGMSRRALAHHSSILTALFNKRGSGFSPHYPQSSGKP